MLTTGFMLGCLTVGGFYLIYRKFPHRLKRYLCERPLLSDLVAAIFTYILFSGTIIGLFAAAFAGIIVSILLAIRKNEFILYCIDWLRNQCYGFFAWLETFGPKKEEENENRNNRNSGEKTRSEQNDQEIIFPNGQKVPLSNR